MVFYKRKNMRMRRRPYRKVARTKTGAKVNSNTLLTTKVNRIEKKLAQGFQTLYYKRSFSAGNIVEPYNWYLINSIPNLVQVFGGVQSDEASNKVYPKKMQMDINIRPHLESDPVDYTMFIVKLKSNVQNSTYDRTTGQLSLTVDEDYVQQSATGQCWLNPGIFKILKSYRFKTESNPNTIPDVRTINFRRRFTKYFKNEVWSNNEGNWTQSNIPISKRYFILIFNNNVSSLEGAPQIDFNCLWTVRSPV